MRAEMKRAKKSDWKIKKAPKQRVDLGYEAFFTDADA
jgi:hypothetical protein